MYLNSLNECTTCLSLHLIFIDWLTEDKLIKWAKVPRIFLNSVQDIFVITKANYGVIYLKFNYQLSNPNQCKMSILPKKKKQ